MQKQVENIATPRPPSFGNKMSQTGEVPVPTSQPTSSLPVWEPC